MSYQKSKHDEIENAIQKAAQKKLLKKGQPYKREYLWEIINKFCRIPNDQFHPSYHCINYPHKSRISVCPLCEGNEKHRPIFKKMGNRGFYEIL